VSEEFIGLGLFFLGLGVGFDLGRRHRHHRHAAKSINILFGGEKVTQMNQKVNNQLPFTIAPADEFGNATGGNFDAPPVWSIDDPTVASVLAAADGLSGVVTPTGKLGSCNLQVLASVGGQSLQGTAALVEIAGDTAEIALIPGTPVLFVPPAPAPAPAPAPGAQAKK
jgi:hypothetical protein